MKYVFLGFISYLIGNFSGGIIVSKIILGEDIRSHGSGNAGATNALRVFGKRIGALTFLIDFLKGLIMVLIGKYLFGDIGILISGLAVVIGHDWPAVFSFRGGKGIATSFGVLVLAAPKFVLAMLVLFTVVVSISKYVSLGSIIMSICAILLGVYKIYTEVNTYIGILLIALGIISIYKHIPNIIRLINGNE
ncbi:MAG: glycerol-3-phosphate 1-O-acyltransferase PlsY, partial [Tissierellia bacterium]|nr:glycerol-3-phosphate 1-O-acyltransferase PlsY [Tissierellia bacterium]